MLMNALAPKKPKSRQLFYFIIFFYSVIDVIKIVAKYNTLNKTLLSKGKSKNFKTYLKKYNYTKKDRQRTFLNSTLLFFSLLPLSLSLIPP